MSAPFLSARPARARKTMPNRRSEAHQSFVCLDCGVVFMHDYAHKDHMQLLHDPEDSERRHLCWECGELFPTLIQYNDHMVRHDLISLVEGVNENERRRELKKRRKIEHKVDADKNPRSPIIKKADGIENGARQDSVVDQSPAPKSLPPLSPSMAVKRPRVVSSASAHKKSDSLTATPLPSPVSSEPGLLRSSGSQCPACKNYLENANIMIEHAVEQHDAIIKDVELRSFKGTEILEVCKMQDRPSCEFCSEAFATPTAYFLHQTTTHRSDLLLRRPDADKFVLLVEALFRNSTSFKISIAVRRKPSAQPLID